MNHIPPLCLGPFQDALVMKVIVRIEQAFAEIAAEHSVDETDLRTWVAWSATRLPAPEAEQVAP